MYLSGDSLLLSLFTMILPTLIVLIGTIVYSYTVIKRYSNVLSRLYRSSFRGVDTERKRIASELHNHLAVHSISVSQEFASLKRKLIGEHLDELNRLESSFDLFHYKTHQVIEYLYPKELLESDWVASFNLLANRMSIGQINVQFENFARSWPKTDWLHHTYWAVQEIISNAIRHSKVNSVQISVVDEDGNFIISIHYKATEEAKKWLGSKAESNLGMGTLIIKDRLKTVDAHMVIDVKNDVVTHHIYLKNENSVTR